ncbi:SDR family NAD(P)-dependent oxidoreductase [Paenibacillus macquariensis]|uniref:NAD(P)-dependent dehydrogenase, short-chain alcohol dehydrogenase family n=1 Tax=Paenibacillus macquariensis TaxID=948756 RepID=A0ABY1KC36_9BACL|nr:SDR family NAD(P)-dependent oxidoreductase [Paenibacillus macquariensis]MEC0089605.1 SDR family NAD(P)-dependent oxidoreductase [Paenibacillus macquariensis]OAB30903.1 short-chain dehydrogenase [Paenibacillus macquariensis subsp. macquariensis]SIR58312.1 NAD(P)-dependent dehydrogenase, short-chain alcohol dehydrogenase family [Paenibacillus macquariensis]
MRLANKIILITGSGSGIGKSSALLFAREGATVIVNDLDEAKGLETVNDIHASGGKGHFIHADVTNPESVLQMVNQIIEKYGQIDVLFNNAGISGVGALHEIEPDAWDRVIQVNIRGVYLPSKYVVPHMMERKSGNIINMSSCVAEIGLARRASYSATKGAVLALTKSMQVDYAEYNIRVNALLPGTILTPFVENFLKTSYDDPATALASIKKRQLSEELGSPEDVAQAALFLASDESKFMMGSPLYIDGGATFGKNA